MKIYFWSVGKAHEPYVKPGIEIFTKRISHYYTVEWKIIPSAKNAASLSQEELKKTESEIIFNNLKPDDELIVLDEKGKQQTSEQLAGFIQQKANNSTKHLIFLIGGVYGVDDIILKRANFTWSLSQLVFPHQLVRLILSEQIYRACTILRNEKYHHS
jgi:23S rRNA (pseudouridine1915-N3)-methyltransferase